MVKKDNKKEPKQDDSKLFAFLAVLLSVVGFIIAYSMKKDNKYVMFYAKQSLVLFIGWIALWIVGMVLGFIPFLGIMVHWILSLGLLVLWVMGLIYSLSGEMKHIPLVGDFAKRIDL
ncbi:MAG: DUF4870 domain-containing protein [Candidatus Pacearchaeota archaeon]